MSSFAVFDSMSASRKEARGLRFVLTALAGVLLAGTAMQASAAKDTTDFDLNAATIPEIQAAMDAGALTSERLVQLYLNRIATYDDHGPSLNAIIAVNKKALETARALDAERAQKGPRSPLHGVPVLLKDNYNTSDMPTTGGSITLADSVPSKDAYTVKRLRDMGAIILGKANLSEYATPAGRGAYSSINDVTKNPHRLESDPGGSSGGSGASAAANFATVTMGTDTGGSIRGPAASNGVVGIRPTYGLVSRSGIIPQALSLDTAGPLARNVTDAAIILGAIAGTDPEDATTVESEKQGQADYTKYLDKTALKGARIGVVRNFFGGNAEVDALVNASIEDMKKLGAEVVEMSFDKDFVSAIMGYRNHVNSEFQPDLEAYLSTLGEGYPKTLAEVVAIYESPEVRNSATPVNPGLVDTHKKNMAIAGKDRPEYLRVINEEMPKVRSTLLSLMDQHKVDAMVWPTSPCTADPRYTLKEADRKCDKAVPVPSNIASYSGFPDIQVPAGYTSQGLPSTVSFVGRPYSEPSLIGFAYAYEQATMHRKLPALFPALPTENFKY